MRRQTLLAGLTLVLEFGACVDTGRADLFCEQPVWNAGQVHNGVPLERHFTFTNRGAAAVEITDMRSTCGCLSPRLEKRTLGPGETATLLLEINTLALAEGTQSWRTRLLYRDGETTKELELVIVGDVVTEVLVQPSALTLPADLPGIHELTVTDRRPQPLRIRAADSGTPFLRTSITDPERAGTVTVQHVRLEIPPSCPEGRHEVVVHLYSDDPIYRELKVPVTVVKRPRQSVTASPRQVTFDCDRGQAPSPRVVRLSAADGSAVEIERVEAADPAVHCTWTRDTVTVEIDPARLTGDLQTTVRVHLRKPVAETVAISVICVVR